jgi:hypothetical protein
MLATTSLGTPLISRSAFHTTSKEACRDVACDATRCSSDDVSSGWR